MPRAALPTIDKQRVLEALRERLEEQLRALTTSQKAAQSGATHEEARQEHPKDTRAIEAQYLARGLAERVERLRDAVATLAALPLSKAGGDDEIGLAALVGVVDETGQVARYFIVPAGGGELLDVDGMAIQSLTPASPLGSALIGKQVGDDALVTLPKGRLTLTIEWIA